MNEMSLCYLIKRHGLFFPALPFPIENFIGITSLYQTIRKTNVTLLNQYECLLPEQQFSNLKCRLTVEEVTEISSKIKLNYKDIVNMQDVTGVYKIEFTDKDQVPSSSDVTNTVNTVRHKSKLKGIGVNFLNEFSDPKNIPETEIWDIDSNLYGKINKKSFGGFAK